MRPFNWSTRLARYTACGLIFFHMETYRPRIGLPWLPDLTYLKMSPLQNNAIRIRLTIQILFLLAQVLVHRGFEAIATWLVSIIVLFLLHSFLLRFAFLLWFWFALRFTFSFDCLFTWMIWDMKKLYCFTPGLLRRSCDWTKSSPSLILWSHSWDLSRGTQIKSWEFTWYFYALDEDTWPPAALPHSCQWSPNIVAQSSPRWSYRSPWVTSQQLFRKQAGCVEIRWLSSWLCKNALQGLELIFKCLQSFLVFNTNWCDFDGDGTSFVSQLWHP